MRQTYDFESFAEQAWLPAEQVRKILEAGLLDLDGDGIFDEYDIYRLQCVAIYQSLGHSIDEIREIMTTSNDVVARRLFAPPERTFTLEETAQRVGLPADKLETLAATLGIQSVCFGEEDIEVLRSVKVMEEVGLSWEAVIEGARVYADSLRRLAEAEVRMTHAYLCEPQKKAGLDENEVAVNVYSAVETLQSVLDPLIQHLHHDYLVREAIDHAFSHFAGGAGSAPGTFEATIMFVDLSLFTSLTESQGDLAAAELIDKFDQLVRRVVFEQGGTLVKQLGDAFMLKFNAPLDAVRSAIALESASEHETNFPALRIGIHSGPVVYKVGDYVGHTVNIASRVASMALPSTILLTESVAQSVMGEGIEVEQVGLRRARGMQNPLTLYRVVRAVPARDPVCGDLVGNPQARFRHEGREYVFCSEKCLKLFLDNPVEYAVLAVS